MPGELLEFQAVTCVQGGPLCGRHTTGSSIPPTGGAVGQRLRHADTLYASRPHSGTGSRVAEGGRIHCAPAFPTRILREHPAHIGMSRFSDWRQASSELD